MDDFISVSFSGGKDSTAMLLGMIERGEHIDEIINVDTGKEFPEMYEHIERIKEYVQAYNIPFVTLKAPYPFEWYMLEKPIDSDKYGFHKGYGWPSATVRWCTKILKTNLINAHYKELNEHHNVIQCIGLASDEIKRLSRPHNKNENHRHPLVEWGLTEKDCLEYCYSKGYDWGGLYQIFKRVSCWCCPLASIPELKKLWIHYPDLWGQLQDWENKLNASPFKLLQFKEYYTVAELTARFEREAHAEKTQTNLIKWGVEIE